MIVTPGSSIRVISPALWGTIFLAVPCSLRLNHVGDASKSTGG
jgi:hypothetical protein